MSFEKPIRRVAVVGTGVIGASWAAQYLARGLDVVATDPAPNAEANLRNYVDEAWGQLEEIGLSPGASRDRLSFTKDSDQAFAKADFVQENGPERPDFKMKLFAHIDEATPARFDHRVELVGNNPKRDSIGVQAPGAGHCRPSVQSAPHRPTCRSGGRHQDIA